MPLVSQPDISFDPRIETSWTLNLHSSNPAQIFVIEMEFFYFYIYIYLNNLKCKIRDSWEVLQRNL